MILRYCLSIIFLFGVVINIQAQKGFYIKRLSAGYRISETELIGTNPFTALPLLKDPTEYLHLLSTFRYNAWGGSPGPETIHTFYANAEIYKNRRNGFWKHTYLQTGLFAMKNINTTAGLLTHFGDIEADSTQFNTTYSFTHQTQFFGLNFGINRTTKIAKRLQSTIGLQLQGMVALIHKYQSHLDSSSQSGFSSPWKTIYSKQLSTSQARNYFQWQIMLPLGIEYEAWKQRLTIRIEIAPGYIRNKYLNKSFAASEAHSAGLWLIYQL